MMRKGISKGSSRSPAALFALMAICGAYAVGCREDSPGAETAVDAHAGHNPADDDHSGPDHSGEDSAAEWCFEHDVPEAVCTRCNPALIEKFKATGDWCGGHGIPESHCLLCNPELAAKFAAMRPKTDNAVTPGDDDAIRVERTATTLRPVNDTLCDVEASIIRLLDPSIAAKSGIRAEPAATRRISAVIQSAAEVRYDQTRSARITPRAAGVVVDVPVDLGAMVDTGDALAVLDSPAIGQAKTAYIETLQRHAIAEADLARHNRIHGGIERMLEACSQEVLSGKIREQYAEIRIGEYKSRLLNAHAQLELSQKRFTREQGLVERGISSQDAFQTIQRDLEQARAEFAATHEAIEIEMDKEHQALARALTVADVSLDAARRRLLILGVDQTAIEPLNAGRDENLSRYTLRSPMSGSIVKRSAVVGENVDTDDVLFAVADTSRMWLLLSLAERDLASVRRGQRVLFTVDGLPGRSFAGQLDWISSEVEEPSRTVRARVPLDNSDGLLRANMFGSARVIVHDNDEVLSVPPSAVQTDGCCNIVFVKESDTVYRPRKVVLGSTTATAVEIVSGLQAGEPVVTTGSFLLKTEILKSNIGAGCCEVDPGR